MKIQDYLLTHSGNDLEKEHGIFIHPAKDGIALSINYDHLESKETDPLTWECRGLVIARKGGKPYLDLSEVVGDTVVLARTPARFFNQGSPNAANVDFSDPSTIFWEKLDGTFNALYYNPFKNEWHIATRAVPEADVPMNASGLTFRQLFEKCLEATAKVTFQQFTSELIGNLTYCFEACSPDNNVVVRYEDYTITLWGVRENNGTEHNPRYSMVHNVFHIPVPRSFSFNNLEEAVAYINKFGPLELEGLVVCDKNFNRVKVKTSAYLDFAHAKQSLGSDRSFLNLILKGTVDDVAPLLVKVWQDRIVELTEALKDLNDRYEGAYHRIYNADRKTFAITCQKEKVHLGSFMARWEGKCGNFLSWVQSRKNPDGDFSNGVLDLVLDLIGE